MQYLQRMKEYNGMFNWPVQLEEQLEGVLRFHRWREQKSEICKKLKFTQQLLQMERQYLLYSLLRRYIHRLTISFLNVWKKYLTRFSHNLKPDCNFICLFQSLRCALPCQALTYQMMMISRAQSWRVADHITILLHMNELVLVGASQNDHHLKVQVRSEEIICWIQFFKIMA